MKRVLLLLLMKFCWWGVSFSQVTISGVVTDEGNNPLWGANVILEGTVIGGVTNYEGYFVLQNVPKGIYTLQVSYIGFEKNMITLEAGKDLNLEIQLTSSAILADEVFVLGTRARPETPVTYSGLSREKISERNMGRDMPYMINTLPSVVVTSDAGNGIGYTSFRVRGTDLSRINVTLNGIPLNDSESHGVWWVDLPDIASSVEDLQLQRGVGTSTNGAGAFGATLNLQTFTLEKDPYTEMSSSAGSYRSFKNTLRFGTGLLSGRFTLDGRISAISSDGYIERASSDMSSFAFSGAYYGPRKDIVRMVIMSGKEKTYQSWDGVPGEMLAVRRRYNGMGAYTDENGITRYYDNETDNYQQDHFQLLYSKAFNDQILFNAALHYTHGMGYYEQYKEDQVFSDYLLPDVIISGDTIRRTDLIRQKWLDNDFYGTVFNLNIKEGKLNFDVGGGWNRYAGDHFGKVIWARYFSSGEKGHKWYDNTGLKTDGNLYAKAGLRISTSWYTYLDVQYRGINYEMQGPDDDLRDITQLHRYHFFNPKLGLRYYFPGGASLYGSFAIAHREPTRYNFKDAPLSGPVPRPEVLRDLEIGIETRLGAAEVSANIYYMNYRDQLVLTGQINDVGMPVMTNVPESYRLGIEWISRIQFTNRLSWEINATVSRNKILNFTQYIDDWDTWTQRVFPLGTTDISFSPDLIVKSILEYTITKGLKVQWLSGYVGRQYIDNSSNHYRALDPYWINDLSLHTDLKVKGTKYIRFHVSVNNLLNNVYESNAWVYPYYEGNELKMITGFYPQAGRNFLLGLKFRL